MVDPLGEVTNSRTDDTDNRSFREGPGGGLGGESAQGGGFQNSQGVRVLRFRKVGSFWEGRKEREGGRVKDGREGRGGGEGKSHE